MRSLAGIKWQEVGTAWFCCAGSVQRTCQYEKCYGIAKAGKNDCFTAKNACGGTSEVDRQGDAWIYLPTGVCAKIVGGSLEPKR